MRKFKASVLAGFAAALCLAQTATEYDSPAVNRVAARFNCDCGCKLRMDCQMQPGCGVCKRAKLQILELQNQGKTDEQIVDQFVKENGADILAVPPGILGVAGPYIALAIGLGFVVLVIRRYLRPRPAPAGAETPAGDPLLDRYQAQIEKDLEKLD
jgi:cytochrome c-type biogenesis protein CcmH/NrfF